MTESSWRFSTPRLTGGTGTRQTGWLSDEPLRDWDGVNTDETGRVTILFLAENELSGEIPAELGNLTQLKELFLFGNKLSGEIPAELGRLTNLTELSLSYNEFSGEIPPELGKLTNLTELNLDNNEFSGEIPVRNWGG